ncbi:sulfotransferase [Emcibacter sp. SYSU 3D8]|uniref:tetratricopeptide repeat-containing sulfotransferase family protein n=1 Tax=Emcibacter sp. SYSU 3D8 TaxID=3133969 RepID=UPI0031FEB5E3
MEQKQPEQKRIKREDAVTMAINLASQGKLPAALSLSEQLITQFPHDANTIAMRAFVLHRAGQLAGAIEVLERAVARDANLPVFHSNLCEMYRQSRDLDSAASHGRKAVSLAPGYADAWNNLGIVHFERKELDDAEAAYKRAIEIKPAFAEAHNNLGNLYRVREQADASIRCYERAVELRPTYVEALTNAGKAYLAQRGFAAAEKLFRRATEIKPDHMEALTGIASASHGLGNSNYALTLLSRMTTMYPGKLEPLLMMAQLLQEEHKLNGALAAAEQALALDDGDHRALALMGRVKREMGLTEESLDWFNRALAAEPDSVDLNNQIGASHMELGNMDEARRYFENAIGIAPDALRVYTNLAGAKKFTKKDIHYKNFIAASASVDGLSDHEKIGVYYALGKVYDDVGESRKAMEAFMAGARLKRAELNYNKQASLYLFDRIREVFTREALDAKRAQIRGSDTAAPILVLGMPRSGSTLTEQIISSHSQVFGAGEVRTLNQSLNETVVKDFSESVRFPEVFQFLSQKHADGIVASYLRDVPNWSGHTPHFTDKMLTNFFYIGLINLIMPNAKIVHIRRNPIDNCISCFTRLFREDLPYSYDFDDLADYYGKYAQLMDHWRQVLPAGAFHEVNYEDLVADTEGKARELIEFIGLPWEEQCLSFYEAKRPVKTASVTQVREPIYTRSVDRWKKYGTVIQPLIDRLAAQET